MTTFNPGDLEPQDLYKLLIGLVVPRPIAWVGTVSAEGVPNLAPFSFFNVFGVTPPTVVFSPIGNVAKDTLENVTLTGEFTLNSVTEEVLAAMNQTATTASVDEFAVAGLTPHESDVVAAPRVAEAKASMEALVRQIIPIGDGPMRANLVVGEVVRIHVADHLLDGTRVLPHELRAVGKLAGPDYALTREIVSHHRPG
ncbi:MAG: flavin reductase family protein [Acidimicrobiia bacterium]|nr:flavin reductase family protein [Acidimicrobiia bacterium]